MMKLLLNLEDAILSRFNWYRQATDVECKCVNCGTSIGYVWRQGHRRWRCGDCTDNGNAKAV